VAVSVASNVPSVLPRAPLGSTIRERSDSAGSRWKCSSSREGLRRPSSVISLTSTGVRVRSTSACGCGESRSMGALRRSSSTRACLSGSR
jgi:hypothetical protein